MHKDKNQIGIGEARFLFLGNAKNVEEMKTQIRDKLPEDKKKKLKETLDKLHAKKHDEKIEWSARERGKFVESLKTELDKKESGDVLKLIQNEIENELTENEFDKKAEDYEGFDGDANEARKAIEEAWETNTKKLTSDDKTKLQNDVLKLMESAAKDDGHEIFKDLGIFDIQGLGIGRVDKMVTKAEAKKIAEFIKDKAEEIGNRKVETTSTPVGATAATDLSSQPKTSEIKKMGEAINNLENQFPISNEKLDELGIPLGGLGDEPEWMGREIETTKIVSARILIEKSATKEIEAKLKEINLPQPLSINKKNLVSAMAENAAKILQSNNLNADDILDLQKIQEGHKKVDWEDSVLTWMRNKGETWLKARKNPAYKAGIRSKEDVENLIKKGLNLDNIQIEKQLDNEKLKPYLDKLPRYLKQLGNVRGIELVKGNEVQPAFIFEYLALGGNIEKDIQKIILAEKWETAPDGQKNLKEKVNNLAESFGLQIDPEEVKEFLKALSEKDPNDLAEFEENANELIGLSISLGGYLPSSPEKKQEALAVLDSELIENKKMSLSHLTKEGVLENLEKNLETIQSIEKATNELMGKILGDSAKKEIDEFGEKFGISIATENLAAQLKPFISKISEGEGVDFVTILDKKDKFLEHLNAANKNFGDSEKLKSALAEIQTITSSKFDLSKIQENIKTTVDELLGSAETAINSFIAEKLRIKLGKNGEYSEKDQATINRFKKQLTPKALELLGKYLKQEKGVGMELMQDGKLNIGALVEYATKTEGVNLKEIVNGNADSASQGKLKIELGKDMQEFFKWSADSDDEEIIKIRREVVDASADAWAGNDIMKIVFVSLIRLIRGMFGKTGKFFGPILRPIYQAIEKKIPAEYRDIAPLFSADIFGNEVTRQPADTEKAEKNILQVTKDQEVGMDINTRFYLKERWGDVEEKSTNKGQAPKDIRTYYALQLKEIFKKSGNEEVKNLTKDAEAVKLNQIVESLYKANKVDEKLTDKKLENKNGEIVVESVIIGKGGEITAENQEMIGDMAEDYAKFMPAWKSFYEELSEENKSGVLNVMNLVIQNSDYKSMTEFASALALQKVTGKESTKSSEDLIKIFKQNKLTRIMYSHLYEWKETQKDKSWEDLLKEDADKVLSKLKTLGYDWSSLTDQVLGFFSKNKK